jgi:hypothetical protein
VYEAISTLEKYPFQKKLLHGDFGTHNFIKYQDKFNGVIDSCPAIGDPTYDLIFALVSNVTLLPRVPIEYLFEIIDEPHEKISALLMVILFCRLGRCLKHHKQDFDDYVDYWYKNFNS